MHIAPFNPKQFRSACSRFPTGITITTVIGVDGKPYGITFSSFTSVSLNPPLVLVCIDQITNNKAFLDWPILWRKYPERTPAGTFCVLLE
ncbi:MAG: hypothetical protein DMG65_04725 [Candidatus Angelobacter sp. Gp1-AA117]|nr:MAG: hypothetical protein DMG65_04725 [Candidatus Angelobacter sp. Gp1-AA117]